MKAQIVIAAHKPYRFPQDPVYLPLQVGKNGGPGFGIAGDDTGDNISEKNPRFCELTGIYWAVHNLDVDYIGLVHYRRYFALRKTRDRFDGILSADQLQALLSQNDVLLPRKQHYYIESLYSHYAHTHSESHLIALRRVLSERFPDYLEAFDNLKRRTSAHMFNMFVMRRDLLAAYCDFLFETLFTLEKELDLSGMSDFEARLFGRLSELLLDVWIEKNHIAYREIPYVYMEKVSLLKKGIGFLKAKFFGKKYDKSF